MPEQDRLAQIIDHLPPVGSPGFRAAFGPAGNLAETLPLEALAWALRQLAQNQQFEVAREMAEVIYLRYEKRAEQLAKSCPYLRLFDSARRRELAEHVLSEAWEKAFQKLYSGEESFFEKNFDYKFATEVKSAGRNILRQEGYATRAASEATPERVPAGSKVSLDAPVPSNEEYRLEELIPDGKAEDFYRLSELAALLEAVLTPEEIRLFLLAAERFSKSEIARRTGLDWQTVDRRLNKVRQKLVQALEETGQGYSVKKKA